MSSAGSRGYSLLELVVAMLFGSIVLIGLYNVFSSMVNFQMEAMRKSSVTAWTLASLNQMNKEVENANVVYFPNPTNQVGNAVIGCSNWSTLENGPTGVLGTAIDANQTTTYFYYCYDTTTSPPNNLLRRITAAGNAPAFKCPPFLPVMSAGSLPACVAGAVTLPGGVASTGNDVVATDVNQGSAGNIFTFDQSVNGIDVNYVVGNPNPGSVGTPGARVINPQTMTINTSISLVRPYLNTND